MKFKMSDKSLFALLLRSPWWISFVIAAVLGAVASALLPQAVSGVGMFMGFPFVVIGTLAAWRQCQAPKPAHVAQALQRCAAMSWNEFADAIEQAYARQGYAVTRLNQAAADFSLEKQGKLTVLSCKRWKAASHGVGVLTDLEALRQSMGAQDASYIALGSVSENASRFAKEQGIYLMPELELAKLFMQSGT